MRWSVLPVLVLAACSGSRTEAAPVGDHAPSIAVAPIAGDALCVTKGAIADGVVGVPTMRGFALGGGGDAAQLTFTYKGESQDSRALASGELRRQIGLKLRAQDSCNVVYVMWRLDPRPKIDVSIKLNPGKATHEECGASGYTKVKSRAQHYVPAFEFGTTHVLRAEIVGDSLYAWIDGRMVFEGHLPDAARALSGPAGLRSDNVAFELVELAVPAAGGAGGAAGAAGAAGPACKHDSAAE